MVHNMMENFQITIYMDLEFIHGLMEEFSEVNGKIMEWMGKENLVGLVFSLFYGVFIFFFINTLDGRKYVG